MPRRTGVRRRPAPDPGPFDRSEATWRALSAPVDLYDPGAAAAAELEAHEAVLEPGQAGYPGPLDFYARRWWRRHRAAFLAAVGDLTVAEARTLARRGRPRRS